MSLEKEVKTELNNEKYKWIFVIVFFIMLIFGIIFLVKTELNKLNANIEDIWDTKEIVFWNINNEKNTENNFEIKILNENKNFRDIETFKSYLINEEERISNLLYTFIWINWENKDKWKELFNYSLRFKELWFFLNKEEIVEYVKKQILVWNKEIIIDFSKYSYIDQKKILESSTKLKNKYTHDTSNIEFDKEKWFFVNENNLSFYILKVIKENIKKVNLNNPISQESYIYFSMKDNDVNSSINELNNIYNLYQNLNINFNIDSSSNQINLNILDKVKNWNIWLEFDNEGVNISFKWIDNINLFKFEWWNINYIPKDFFKPWMNLKINNSQWEILATGKDFFELKNLNINWNYPLNSDFTKLNINNWFTVNTDYLNKFINEYIEYILINKLFDYDNNKNIVVKYNVTNSNDVNIEKVIWESWEYINDYFKWNFNKKQRLYSTEKESLKIKDINNLYSTIWNIKFYLNWIEYNEWDNIEIWSEKCKIQWFNKNKVHLSCGEKFHTSILTNGLIETNYDMFGFEFDIIFDSNFYIDYENERYEFSIEDNWLKHNSNSYFKIINDNYFKIKQDIIKDIKYNNGNFDIFFENKNLEKWYIKSSYDYNQFFIFFVDLI